MRGEIPHPQGLSQMTGPSLGLRPSGDAAEFSSANDGPRDLVRTILAILFVAGLIATSFWILWPFLPATIWAVTLVVATWPLMLRVQHRLWNRRWLAVVVMTLALLVVFVAPFWLAVATIIQNFDRIVGWGTDLASFKLPPPPAWLDDIPLFGDLFVSLWLRLQTSAVADLAAKAAPMPEAPPAGLSACSAGSASPLCNCC